MEYFTRIYLYALVFLSLLMLIWYSISRWVLHRRALSKRAVLLETVQLVTGLIFLPLFLFGIIGSWTAMSLSWALLVIGFYAVLFLTKPRSSSINDHD
jgi:hypothetical protein